MRSYLHRMVPLGRDNEDADAAESPRSPAISDTLKSRAAESSGSESSSEDGNSDDADGVVVNGRELAHKSRERTWVYSSLGRMPLYERGDPMDLPRAASKEEHLVPMRVEDVTGHSASGGELDQRNQVVLRIGDHL